MSNPYESLPPVPEGYLPPADAYATGRPSDWNDPLVTSELGINGWFRSISSVLKISWSQQLVIFALTHLLPAVVMVVLAIGGFVGFGGFSLESVGRTEIAALLTFGAIYIVVVLLAQVLGYSSATHAATMKAAGRHVTVGQSLAYGVKRLPGLAGWLLASALVIIAPLALVMLCMFNAGPIAILLFLVTLPVLAYLLMATAMVGPVYMFERRSPIGRSFSLFHGRFGPMLGRYLLIFLSMIAYSVIENVMSFASGTAGESLDMGGLAVVVTVVSIVGSVIQLPFTMFQFSAILVTYAERRADEGQITSVDLVAELEGSAHGPQLALEQ